MELASSNNNSTDASTTEDEISLLVVILDTNPGQRILRENPHIFTQCIDCVIGFANAHLMQKAQNKLVMMACHSTLRFVFKHIYTVFVSLYLNFLFN